MMHSDSFISNNGVPPYLRAYAARESYTRIGAVEEKPARIGTHAQRIFRLKRTVGAVAVFLAFVAAISRSKSRWAARGPPDAGKLLQGDGSSYRGIFEAFERRYSGGPVVEEKRGLTLRATNEYGEFDRRALALYGLDMLVEPFRETRITVVPNPSEASASGHYYWLLVRADQSGEPLDGEEALVDAKAGQLATITLTGAGGKYALLVQQVKADGSVLAEERVAITCKYVRRELRDLTEADRVAFFTAMREFYTVPLEEGRAKYGEEFSNAKRVAAYHNTRDYCFHNGMHFLNAHASFDLWVERNLQKIDPKVSLAQWDFMLDAAHLGSEWTSSEIFGPDMFGSAMGYPENDFQISDGWFADITSAYDPDGDLLIPEGSINTIRNPYGLVDGAFNYQALPGVIRTHTYCGLEGVSEFTKCEVFVGCFEDNNSLFDWASCMEHKVHATAHGMLGGGFDCNADMAEFLEENPQIHLDLVTFALEFLLANKWPSNRLMSDYNDCDTACDVDQVEPCGCTCNTDPFEWTDDEVYDFMEGVLLSLQERGNGDKYINEDAKGTYPLGFMQDGNRLDDDSTLLLLRHMMMIGCEPGKVGAMSTGASPLDPIFWVLHTGFEKAQHILQLSPGYRDSYDFEWVATDCGDGVYGGELDDPFPFTERMLGLGDSSELLTNADLLGILHPQNPDLPYVFEDFEKWGTCTDWDPCPECGVHKQQQ